MLYPNLLDQRAAFKSQFEGMSAIAFSYDDYEAARGALIAGVRSALDARDRAFLLSFNRLEPDWSLCDYQDFPSVKWKLFNLEKFRKANIETYQQQLTALDEILDNKYQATCSGQVILDNWVENYRWFGRASELQVSFGSAVQPSQMC